MMSFNGSIRSHLTIFSIEGLWFIGDLEIERRKENLLIEERNFTDVKFNWH